VNYYIYYIFNQLLSQDTFDIYTVDT